MRPISSSNKSSEKYPNNSIKKKLENNNLLFLCSHNQQQQSVRHYLCRISHAVALTVLFVTKTEAIKLYGKITLHLINFVGGLSNIIDLNTYVQCAPIIFDMVRCKYFAFEIFIILNGKQQYSPNLIKLPTEYTFFLGLLTKWLIQFEIAP